MPGCTASKQRLELVCILCTTHKKKYLQISRTSPLLSTFVFTKSNKNSCFSALNRMKRKLWWLLITVIPCDISSFWRQVLWAGMSLSVHVATNKSKFRLSYLHSCNLQKTIRQKHCHFPQVTSLLMYLISAMYLWMKWNGTVLYIHCFGMHNIGSPTGVKFREIK